jgi:hypothetical protein
MENKNFDGQMLLLLEDDNGFSLHQTKMDGYLKPTTVIDTADTYEEMVSIILDNYEGDFEVIDSENEYRIYIESKIVVRMIHAHDSIYPFATEPEIAEKWRVKLSEESDDYKPDCRHCGCIHCDPSSFF